MCTTQKHMKAWNRKAVCSPDGAASLLIVSEEGNLRNLFPESSTVGAPGTSRYSTTTSGVCWTKYQLPRDLLKKPAQAHEKSQKKDLTSHICVWEHDLRNLLSRTSSSKEHHKLTCAFLADQKALHIWSYAPEQVQGLFQTGHLDIHFSCHSEFWYLYAQAPGEIANTSQGRWTLWRIQPLWIFH